MRIGERGDIIKRMHRALIARGIDAARPLGIAGESTRSVNGTHGRARTCDEFKGTAYAVVDRIDGPSTTSAFLHG
ncbi:DUF3363 domain-containing protein [Paracoccus mutanolyticus]|uniref:DUF3363 domain-containing protein n=1 Tax=Paracoccus mutanolyticus TaxID=1499308 RepID=UPI0016764532|nr:DUF3363 domain-containing protein [Paracoccus mutanolyticus]